MDRELGRVWNLIGSILGWLVVVLSSESTRCRAFNRRIKKSTSIVGKKHVIVNTTTQEKN